MSKINETFLSLFLDNGALKLLAKASEQVRSILLTKKLTNDQVQRLGHCGIAGEYLHGVGMLHQDMEFHKIDPEETPVETMIEYLVDCFENPSQLSAASPEIAKEHHQNENCFDAIPRAITDAEEWSKTANLNADEQEKIARSLEQAKTSYIIVRKFAEECRNMAPS